MCITTIATLLGLAAGCVAPLAPADLLAPVDARNATRWHPPSSPVADLKSYAPVDARSDWGSGPPQAQAGEDGMSGMSGMKMPGMNMPGMGGGR